MADTPKEVLERVATWPQEDQEELAEVAREIEGRRDGVYVLNDDEKTAIAAARRGGIATDEDVNTLWRHLGIT